MTRYCIRLEAFGRIAVVNVTAHSREEALRKAQAEHSFRVEVVSPAYAGSQASSLVSL